MRIFISEKMVRPIYKNLDKMKSLINNIDDRDYEARYIYSFALFESAICGAVGNILMAFPEKGKKIPQHISQVYRDLLYPPMLHDILWDVVRSEMRAINKGDASKVLKTAMDYCSINMTYDEKRLSDISKKRNVLTHENTWSVNDSDVMSLQESRQDMTYLHEILLQFAANLEDKYGTYTLERLVKDFWRELFNTPLLPFSKCIKFRPEVRLNLEHLKGVAQSLCSIEKYYLSLLVQQYSPCCNDILFKFADLPLLVSVADKRKLYLILNLFTIYPDLFNGKHIKSH